MKLDLELQNLKNKIKEREILKNCCVQQWASDEEKKHWVKGIEEYDIEIMFLCEKLGENEYDDDQYFIGRLKDSVKEITIK